MELLHAPRTKREPSPRTLLEPRSVAVVGASGFVGRSLIESLRSRPNLRLIGISRRTPRWAGSVPWRAADLFDEDQLTDALRGADVAFYLVHSMLPSDRLKQGSFADYDLLLATRFASVARRSGVKHIIYLGGLLPDGAVKSLHLKSRQEVEDVFLRSGIPTTVLRAGLIIGADGSSFRIMKRLVERLPVLICPRWTRTRATPIALEDVICSLKCALDRATLTARAWDLGGPEDLSYLQMMRILARQQGLRRLFVPIPLDARYLSRLWVRLISGASSELVYPLMDSLGTPMLARPDRRLPDCDCGKTPFAQALSAAARGSVPPPSNQPAPGPRTARSVQRIRAEGVCASAIGLADLYFSWLARGWFPFVRVDREGKDVKICAFARRFALLRLRLRPGNEDCAVFDVLEGGLSGRGSRGSFEFRKTDLPGIFVVTLNDFKPSLPLWFYLVTQAPLHRWVMSGFQRYLNRLQSRIEEEL